MRPAELADALRSALPGVKIAMVRLADVTQAAGPTVLIRQTSGADLGLLDPIGNGARGFALQCRSPTYEGSHRLADAVLAALGGHVVEIVGDGDDRDSMSGQRGGFYARTLEITLAA